MSICSGAISTQPLPHQHFSRRCLSRYTTCARYNMKRILPSLAFLLALPLPLFPQTPAQSVSQPSAPSFVQPAFGQKLRINGIPNAGKISEVLYRGAQPREVGNFSGVGNKIGRAHV